MSGQTPKTTRTRRPYVRFKKSVWLTCDRCGRVFACYAKNARFCSPACRQAGHRARTHKPDTRHEETNQ